MSNPASELERPGTNASNRQAWGGFDGRDGAPGPTGPVGAAPTTAVDNYEYDNSETIRKKGCWYNFSTCVSREFFPDCLMCSDS